MLDMERYGKMLDWVKMLMPLSEDEANKVLEDDDEATIEAKKEAAKKREELYEEILTFALSKTIRDVSNYTNIPVDELPEELDHTMASMAVQLIDTHNFLSVVDSNVDNGNVQSLTEGDTSITFKSKSDVYSAMQTANSVTDNYADTLNNFRKVKW